MLKTAICWAIYIMCSYFYRRGNSLRFCQIIWIYRRNSHKTSTLSYCSILLTGKLCTLHHASLSSILWMLSNADTLIPAYMCPLCVSDTINSRCYDLRVVPLRPSTSWRKCILSFHARDFLYGAVMDKPKISGGGGGKSNPRISTGPGKKVMAVMTV